MSKSWNAGNPSTFCNIYHHRVARENKVVDPRTGRMTEEFWLLSRNERWAALVSNNPHLPIRALRLLEQKYRHINTRSETSHAKRHDDDAWASGRAYIRHRDRTYQRCKLIPQELEQYAADQVIEDEWNDDRRDWWYGDGYMYDQLFYDMWAEDDDAWLTWALERDTMDLEDEIEIFAPPAAPEEVSEDPEFDSILAFAKIFGESFQRVVNGRHYTR